MRIVWTMNGGPASGAAQQEVVLEDLDLLAFSSPMHTKSDSSPLKGVYRDTTFGLRYLHVPDSSDSQKVIRRLPLFSRFIPIQLHGRCIADFKSPSVTPLQRFSSSRRSGTCVRANQQSRAPRRGNEQWRLCLLVLPKSRSHQMLSL
ncbi:hypothetical protein B0H11DRAFT_2024525, partial [Mycena galericulata]